MSSPDELLNNVIIFELGHEYAYVVRLQLAARLATRLTLKGGGSQNFEFVGVRRFKTDAVQSNFLFYLNVYLN